MNQILIGHYENGQEILINQQEIKSSFDFLKTLLEKEIIPKTRDNIKKIISNLQK